MILIKVSDALHACATIVALICIFSLMPFHLAKHFDLGPMKGLASRLIFYICTFGPFLLIRNEHYVPAMVASVLGLIVGILIYRLPCLTPPDREPEPGNLPTYYGEEDPKEPRRRR